MNLGNLASPTLQSSQQPVYDSSAGDLIASHCKNLQSSLCKTPHGWCETRLWKLDSSPSDQETSLLFTPFEPEDVPLLPARLRAKGPVYRLYEVGSILGPILQVRSLRCREVTICSRSHSAEVEKSSF